MFDPSLYIIFHGCDNYLENLTVFPIEPFEESIISYRLKSKIAIVGGFSLPPAKIKFQTYQGKERVVRSNKSSVSMGL